MTFVAGLAPAAPPATQQRRQALVRPHSVWRVLLDLERPSRETLEEWIEEARGEHRRAGARAMMAVARGEGEPAAVRLSNTSPRR